METWNNHTQMDDGACTHRLNAIGDALYVIGGKWKLRIIVALIERHRRFNELQRLVKGISAKVLAAELKELEMNGFVNRIVHVQTPFLIEYELTDYSQSLGGVLDALSEWGVMHKSKIRSQL